MSASPSLAWVLLATAVAAGCSRSTEGPSTPPVAAATPPAVNTAPPASDPVAIPPEIATACGGCHTVPQPGLFTDRTWGPAINLMYGLLDRFYPQKEGYLSKEKVLAFYGKHAARSRPAPQTYAPVSAGGPRFALRPLGPPAGRGPIADLRLEETPNGARAILMTEMLHGEITRLSMGPRSPESRPLATARHPVRALSGDLDGDGKRDLVVAELGVFSADDTVNGAAQIYRDVDGAPTKQALLTGAGRVADLALGDVDGDGRPDLVVAEFGWQKTGALHLFTGAHIAHGTLTYQGRKLDERAGHIAVELADMDGDGDLDLVTALAQHHEAVELWRNDGAGRYERVSLFRANHPMWGLIGLQVTDLDGDGDLDILHYNGDVLDAPKVAGFQGVHLLENQGGGRFTSRQLAQLPGIHDLDVADFDGDGRQDVVAVANLPSGIEHTLAGPTAPPPAAVSFESVLLLRQTEPGAFSVHTLLRDAACFSAVLAADADGDGDQDVVLGPFGMGWSLLGNEGLPPSPDEGLRICEQGQLLWLENGGDPAQTARTQADIGRRPPALPQKITALKTITRHDPANLGYGTVLSDLLLRTGDPKAAVAQLQALLRENPSKTVEGFIGACGPKRPPSCTDVGRLLFAGGQIAGGKAYAARLYETGCGRGEAESCVSLAMMHGAGMGVARSLEKTVIFLDKGCTRGHFGACAKLGEMYGRGDGVVRDPVLAKAYTRRACDGGVPTSCAQLPPGEQRPRLRPTP